jgi:hypothetical protein
VSESMIPTQYAGWSEFMLALGAALALGWLVIWAVFRWAGAARSDDDDSGPPPPAPTGCGLGGCCGVGGCQ